ncbi:pre-rRNA-processing protein esf1 [Coemansia sp. RSA 988]|nr:pre-rRNA-processing protein esf1 [Coemansia sp. RSA 988]
MAPRESKNNARPAKKVTHDARFSHVQEDPRFMRPKKNQAKVKVDKRFAHMIDDKDFTETTKVDKYGRIQEDNRAEEYLRNTYDFDGSEDEDEEKSESNSGSDKDSDSSDGESSEEEGTDVDRARGKGVDSDASSDSEDDSDISDVEWGKYNGVQDGGLSDLEEDPDNIPRGNESKRFACINMDWDHVRAADLFAVFEGFKPDSGVIVSVRIYPSEFGTERMAKEAIEGPPREIFSGSGNKKKTGKDDGDSGVDSSESDTDSDEVDLVKEQVKETEEFDQVALRKYELEKMRYYFAVVDCDSVDTAKTICAQCDGAEYEASANFFDLRFVPDEMEFEQEPKEEAMQRPEHLEPSDFATQALKHSKVELTWDADEPSRVKATRRAFTQEDVDNMDFGNLLASSSDDNSSDEEDLAKKRALLFSGDNKDSDEDSDGQDDDGMGDIEITFTPGLSEAAATRLESKRREAEGPSSHKDETTIERFRRLKMERREKWKNSKKTKPANGNDSDLISDNELDATTANDNFFTYSSDDEKQQSVRLTKKTGGLKKGVRESKSQRKERQNLEAKERAELELLLDGPESERKHFDLNDIVKAEKKKGRKRDKHAESVEDNFKLNVNDPRFGALFDSHNFAIDPNNPNFKKTKAMKELLSESRKRHKTSFD